MSYAGAMDDDLIRNQYMKLLRDIAALQDKCEHDYSDPSHDVATSWYIQSMRCKKCGHLSQVPMVIGFGKL